jgi:hypothetical protein
MKKETGPQVLKCEKCGGEMKKIKKTYNIGIGLLIILVGICLLFVVPIGTIMGIIIILIGCAQCGKRKFFWLCKTCGYKFEREGNWLERQGLK